MTIGFFSQTTVLGGSEVYLRLLLSHLDRQKYRVIFFCNSGHPLLKEQEINALISRGLLSVVTVRTDGPDRSVRGAASGGAAPGPAFSLKAGLLKILPGSLLLLAGTLKEVRRLAGIFKAHHVDLLAFNDTGCEPPVIAARLAHVPRIIGTYHVLPDEEAGAATWVHRLIEWASVRSMHAGIAVSAATKKAWVKRTGVSGAPIAVIYNGIDLTRFAQVNDTVAVRRELDIPDGKMIVGVPARLHPMKGHRYLLEALSRIKGDLEDTVVLFIGGGELQPELELSIDRLGIKGMVRFLGHRTDVARILSVLDLVVLPSVALEALPFALIEAQASGKAVVASDFSGIPEIVEDGVTGILVPPRNSRALADAIVKLLRDPASRGAMGQQGNGRAQALFSLDQMLEKTFQLYEDVLTGGTRSGIRSNEPQSRQDI